jgi:hypothetical protein
MAASSANGVCRLLMDLPGAAKVVGGVVMLKGRIL